MNTGEAPAIEPCASRQLSTFDDCMALQELEAEVGDVEGMQEQIEALEEELSMYRTLAAASKDQQFALIYIRDMDTSQVTQTTGLLTRCWPLSTLSHLITCCVGRATCVWRTGATWT